MRRRQPIAMPTMRSARRWRRAPVRAQRAGRAGDPMTTMWTTRSGPLRRRISPSMRSRGRSGHSGSRKERVAMAGTESTTQPSGTGGCDAHADGAAVRAGRHPGERRGDGGECADVQRPARHRLARHPPDAHVPHRHRRGARQPAPEYHRARREPGDTDDSTATRGSASSSRRRRCGGASRRRKKRAGVPSRCAPATISARSPITRCRRSRRDSAD